MIYRIIAVLMLVCFLSLDSAYALKFVAYGDSRDDMTTFATVTNKVGAENPAVVLHVGDCWGSASATSWVNVIKANAVTNALLNSNLYLVSRGNHESFTALAAVSPTVVRSNSEEYSFTQGNCFFVSCGMDPSANGGYTWLATQLSSAPSQAATWRFIFDHYPIYSTGSGHGANGTTSSGASITQFRALCDQYHVTICFSGHDHIYERSKLIYNGAAVGSGTTFNIGQTPGTIYCVTGSAGAPLYSVGSNWWVGYNNGTYNYTVIDARADSLFFQGKNSSGTIMDAITIIKGTPVAAKYAPNNTIVAQASFSVRMIEKDVLEIKGSPGALYVIRDLSGRLVVHGRLDKSPKYCDMSSLVKGAYSIGIIGSKENIVKKFILR